MRIAAVCWISLLIAFSRVKPVRPICICCICTQTQPITSVLSLFLSLSHEKALEQISPLRISRVK